MKQALQELTETQIEFICSECSISEEELNSMDEVQLYDVVYETMCNIEIEEVCSNDGDEDTERCAIASDIVTILGNAIRDEEGYLEDENE